MTSLTSPAAGAAPIISATTPGGSIAEALLLDADVLTTEIMRRRKDEMQQRARMQRLLRQEKENGSLTDRSHHRGEVCSLALPNTPAAKLDEKIAAAAAQKRRRHEAVGGKADGRPRSDMTCLVDLEAVAAKLESVVKPWQRRGFELQPSDPSLRPEILRIYREHCPEKSLDEVELILSNYAGREAELLAKLQEKYQRALQAPGERLLRN
eukprot:TRINITY_DN60372_c0_g1_i1.p1 TRINITY_DN60372_c0_g1~~TRINITY_DN60372_c0_g1_i1.p1  ORF type:complete len:210 (-),score=64.37 TRINITY_DN60372_c0_g1_i1:177-806(-)